MSSQPILVEDEKAKAAAEAKQTAFVPNFIACFIAVALAIGIAFAGSDTGVKVNFGDGVKIPLFTITAIVAFLVNWIALPIAFCLHTEKFYDLTGGLTYLAMTAVSVGLANDNDTFRRAILGSMIGIWALRLSSFLAMRAHKFGDSRFDLAKHNFWLFAKFWTLQALWCTLTAGAAIAAITAEDPATCEKGERLGALECSISGVGIAIWLIGFGIEVVADRQKTIWRADPSNKGKYITGGLWSWSRHPNYVGEVVLWFGVAVIAGPAMRRAQFVTLISPLFVYALIRFASGVPLLEKASDKKWGGQADYEQYKRDVPIFFPIPKCIRGD